MGNVHKLDKLSLNKLREILEKKKQQKNDIIRDINVIEEKILIKGGVDINSYVGKCFKIASESYIFIYKVSDKDDDDDITVYRNEAMFDYMLINMTNLNDSLEMNIEQRCGYPLDYETLNYGKIIPFEEFKNILLTKFTIANEHLINFIHEWEGRN